MRDVSPNAGAERAGIRRRRIALHPQAVRVRCARAALTLGAVVASFSTTYALCRASGAANGPAILSALLAMSLARKDNATDRKHVVTAPLAIACAAFAAYGVGWLLTTHPALGAAAFVLGMFASIYLHNFGEPARRIGSTLAIPLVAILVAPARADAPGGPAVDLALVASAGIVAFGYVTLAQWFARKTRLTSGARPPGAIPARERTTSPPRAVSAVTRLALQMSVSLAGAFVAGFALFPSHWGWTVFTAFIVAGGARGRGDVAYKAVQRLAGALAGTLCAALLARLWLPSGAGEAIAIVAVLFTGLALRDSSYAYWAACMTLVLALLSGSSGVANVTFLGTRLEAILIGALCAVAAAWFVFPIKTTAVIRKRLAEALLALDDLVASAHLSHALHAEKFATFEYRMLELERVAPPMRLHRRVFGTTDPARHPATWIDLASGLHDRARELDPQRGLAERDRASVRRAIGLSRRAIAQYGKAGPAEDVLSVDSALQRLHETLAAPR